MVQRKAVHAGIARSSKWRIRRRTGKEWARHHGQLEEHAVTVGLREVQRRDVRRPLRRRSIPKAVDADFATIFEHHDGIYLRRKEGKVPNVFG